MVRLVVPYAVMLVASVAPSVQPRAPGLQVHFTWKGVPACSKVSPSFVVEGVPRGTEAIRLTLHDLQVPTYPHGGGTVHYAGSPLVPKGALHNYKGPCPPPAMHHVYRWTVQALGAGGQILAEQDVTLPYPPL
ncbi:MAG: hypothetical protein JO122_03280 [Acetobacteraceae bacterium]|nr:hypothetical protein [Acetobacteraceae bacterium]